MPHGASHKITVIDSGGQRLRRKLSWARKHEASGAGRFVDGAFVFHRLPQNNTGSGLSPGHVPSLADRLAELPSWPDGPACLTTSTPIGFMPYPSPTCVTGGVKEQFPALARFGAGL